MTLVVTIVIRVSSTHSYTDITRVIDYYILVLCVKRFVFPWYG